MKFEDMGPGPLPETPKETSDGRPTLSRSGSNHGDAFKRERPAPPGLMHPDVIEAAIRMLSDQGYRVFKSKDVKTIEASYALRPAMVDSDELVHIATNRVLQDVCINVAMSPAVRWDHADGHYGRLITAKVVVVMPEETEI